MLDVPSALRSLDLSREDDVPDLAWLAASHADPPAFWSALAEHAHRIAPAPRSRSGVSVDLYHDAVGRHAKTARVAFVAHDRRAGWLSLSYADLGARASATAQVWDSASVAPGAVVAIVLPLGVSFCIALAAALRLGLVVSYLPPSLGEQALLHRLKALKPAHIVFDPEHPPPLGPFDELALPLASGGPPHALPPHAYAPKDPCAKLFSPLRAPLLKPALLPAEIAWQNALRDAVFAYRIEAGDALALPGFHLQQHQPAALLSTLLAGATFVHVPLSDLENNPTLLREQPITTLGISPALSEILRAKPAGPLPRLAHWLKSVDEPLDWTAWSDLVKKNGLAKIPSSNLLVDAAAGGALLFSTRRPGSVNAYALPAPGRPYALVDGGSGDPSNAGVFVLSPDKDGFFILARRGAEYLYGSTLLPRRAGRIFPAAEVTERVGTLLGIDGAGVIATPTGGPGAGWAFVLLVFTGGAAAPPDAAAIEAALRADLGDDFVPDRITVLPLYARKKGDKLDADWCQRQYSSGFLARKASHPVFRRLAALRGSLLGAR